MLQNVRLEEGTIFGVGTAEVERHKVSQLIFLWTWTTGAGSKDWTRCRFRAQEGEVGTAFGVEGVVRCCVGGHVRTTMSSED